jgi:hypothetical protein
MFIYKIRKNKMLINGKELKICATSGFNEKFEGMEAQLYVNIVCSVLPKHPVDMLIFEVINGKQQVRSAGYFLNGNDNLDETTILYTAKSLPTKKFWFKIDDYDDHYVGTFLFPEEY